MKTEAEHKVTSEQTDLDKVLEKINEIAKKSADGDYIYRGEQECYDKVSSGLFRESPDLNKADFLVEELQRLILEEAKTYIGQTDGIHKTEDIEVLTELQHFGGKTNLIDFTEDYLIALFFACDGSDEEDGRVILLKRESYASKIRIPPRTIKRVEYQKSIFIELESGVMKPEPDSVVTIPMDLKRPMLNYLEKYHRISTATIYNDLHGFIRRSAYTEYLNGSKYLRGASETEYRETKLDLYKRAITHFTEALKLKDNFDIVYKNRAFAYYEIGKFDKAIEDYSKIIHSGYGSSHNSALLYNNRGLAYAGQGDFAAAIRDYDKAIAVNPEDAGTYNNRGITYDTKGEYDRAIQDFNKAIELNPELTEPYTNLGRIYRAKRDFDESILYFSKAIAVDPENASYYNYRGIAYATKGEYDRAIQDFNKAIELNPMYADAYSYRWVARLYLSEWEKAKADLTTAASMGLDIVALFHNRYKTIEAFEAGLGMKLPKDIAALLQRK